jgi:Putative bacterial sensory transduction regulator
MNFMRDFFGGVVDGLVNGATNHRRAAPTNGSAISHGRIERLCRELGWPVDERERNVIRLHFNGSDGEVRKVRITGVDKSLVSFFVPSDAVLPVDRVPADLLGYLLRRNLNDSGIGMWGIMVNDDDDVTFLIYYMALGDGLDAEALKYICESLTSEAADFDDRLRKAGLLD